jgi:sugar lactone lactonase YvrE
MSMNESQAELILDARNGTGESPVWNAAEQALYWVDIPAKRLCRWSAADAALTEWVAPEMLACVAAMGTTQDWIAGTESGIFRLSPQADGQLGFKQLAAVAHAMPGMRFNDGRCDRQGRFLAGTMLMNMAAGARVGCIYSYQKDSELKKLLDEKGRE